MKISKNIKIDRYNRERFLKYRQQYMSSISELAEILCNINMVDPSNYALSEDFSELVNTKRQNHTHKVLPMESNSDLTQAPIGTGHKGGHDD